AAPASGVHLRGGAEPGAEARRGYVRSIPRARRPIVRRSTPEASMNHLLIPFILLDMVVTAIVVVVAMRLRTSPLAVSLRNLTSIVGMDQLRALEQFAREQHQHIGEYMRANWSGNPDQLPAVITALLNDLERSAREKNLPLQRDLLKAMLASSLRAHRI